MSVSSALVFFFSFPFPSSFYIFFLPLIKKKKGIITVLAGCSSLPVPPSWQPQHKMPCGERRMLNPGTLFNPTQHKWRSSRRWLPRTGQRRGSPPQPPPNGMRMLLGWLFLILGRGCGRGSQ